MLTVYIFYSFKNDLKMKLHSVIELFLSESKLGHVRPMIHITHLSPFKVAHQAKG